MKLLMYIVVAVGLAFFWTAIVFVIFPHTDPLILLVIFLLLVVACFVAMCLGSVA